MQKSAAETMRKNWSVIVIAVLIENVERRTPNAEHPNQTAFSIRRWTLNVERWAFASSSSLAFVLHHQNQCANQRRGQQDADAEQRPNVMRHQCFTDLFHGEGLGHRRTN